MSASPCAAERMAGLRGGSPGTAGKVQACAPSAAEDATAYLGTIESPAGPAIFAVNDEGALLRLAFVEGRYERSIEEELLRDGFRLGRDPGRTAPARQELLEYATSVRRTFDVPLVLAGSAWQIAVWRALIGIPFGETRSYAQLAATIGRPRAARALGRANATNRLPLVVPCHRLVGANGSLTGFGGGLHLQARLLEHEARVLAETH